MASEHVISVDGSFAKSGESWNSRDLDMLGQTSTVSGTNHHGGTATATTSVAPIDIGAVVTCGWLWLKNRGAWPIHLRIGSGGTNTIVFPAGIGYAVYLSASTPYVIAVGGSAKYEYKLFEA